MLMATTAPSPNRRSSVFSESAQRDRGIWLGSEIVAISIQFNTEPLIHDARVYSGGFEGALR